MFRRILKTLAPALAGSLLVAALGGVAAASGGDEVLAKSAVVGSVKVELTFKSGHPKTGENPLVVRLEDMSGNPVGATGVSVSAAMRMDEKKQASSGGHGSSDMSNRNEPLRAQLTSAGTSGDYQGTLAFTDAGEWEIRLTFIEKGSAAEAAFLVDVEQGSSGPNYLVLGGFAVLVAAALVLAAVLRPKSPASESRMMAR